MDNYTAHKQMKQITESMKETSFYDALRMATDALEEKIKREEESCEDCKVVNADISIEDMNLSVRAYNCLCRANIRTLADFDGVTMEKLAKIRNLGRKSMMEIIEKLKPYGIEVGE